MKPFFPFVAHGLLMLLVQVRSPGLSQEEFLDQNYADTAYDWQSECFSDSESVNGNSNELTVVTLINT